MPKPKVIAIVGPTASGKSSLGIFLAQKLGGEIISADSRQVYKSMEVITRAPTDKELASVPHHLVNFIDPKRTYSAGTFVRDAKKIIAEIIERGHVPIVVGGTGFYADALLRGLSLPEVQPNKKLRVELGKQTTDQLLSMLKDLDAKSAERIDIHNRVRLIRAIEIAQALGSVPTLVEDPQYETLWLGIHPDAKKHDTAIRHGVEDRLKQGMVDEAKKLRVALSKKRFLSLGFEFSPLADFIDNNITSAELEETLVHGELGYIKRQMRWFRRNTNIVWIKNKTDALQRAKMFCCTIGRH